MAPTGYNSSPTSAVAVKKVRGGGRKGERASNNWFRLEGTGFMVQAEAEAETITLYADNLYAIYDARDPYILRWIESQVTGRRRRSLPRPTMISRENHSYIVSWKKEDPHETAVE